MLYANTDDGSSALWVCDGNGIVVDNVSYSIGDRAPILEQINEHYGTSFTGWSDNEIGLRLGDTIPDWDAYEKIEMPLPNFLKTELGGGGYIFGEIVDNNFNLSGEPSENKCDIIQDGRKVALSYDLAAYIRSVLTPRLENAGYNFNTIQIVSSQYEIGDEIPNWNKFTLIV